MGRNKQSDEHFVIVNFTWSNLNFS